MRISRTASWNMVIALVIPFVLTAPGCSSTSTGLPQRTDLEFTLQVVPGIEFEREWVTVTFDDGSGSQTVQGTEFEGGLAGAARTERFVLPPEGQVAIHVEIAPDGVVIGEADTTLDLGENRRWIIRISLDPEDPVPCFSCVGWQEVSFTGGSLPVDTFWVIEILGNIVGGGIT